MKWKIKKYCFNVSSDTACMQVILKPHDDDEVPLKLRLYWKASDSDSTMTHLGKKKFHKGSDIKKHLKKHNKDDEYYKSRNAFDQFYKQLSEKKELANLSKHTENDNSTSSPGAMSKKLTEAASGNPQKRLTHRSNSSRKSVEKGKTTLSKSQENGTVPEISVPEIIHNPFNTETENKAENTESERNETQERECEVKERNKRAAKKKKAKKMMTTLPPTESEASDEDEEEELEESEEDEDQEEEEEEEDEEEEKEDADQEEKGDAGIPLKPNQFPIVVAQGDVNLAEHLAGRANGLDSSAADTSEEHNVPGQNQGQAQPFYFDPGALRQPLNAFYSNPDAGNAFYNNPEAGNVFYNNPEAGNAHYDEDAHYPEAGSEDYGDPGARDGQRLNSCQLPSPRKTSEVLCKVLPRKMVCKMYCIHGHTFPEGIVRQTECELSKGVWSRKFDECLPFVDCTLKLKTAGYLKCTTNTVQVGPRCKVECKKYGQNELTGVKTYECDATGRWDPPLPHCVEREGIDVVQPPYNMNQGSIDYPQ